LKKLIDGRVVNTYRSLGMPQTTNVARMAVLESAIAAFAIKGYAGTSVQDILSATKLSKPTLYYYFGSKAGLFRAILDFAYRESFALVKSRADTKPDTEERLMEIAAALFSFARTHQHLTRLVFASAFAAPGEIPADSLDPVKRQQLLHYVEIFIRDGQKKGSLSRSYKPRELADGFLGVVIHQIRMSILRGNIPLTRARARRIVALFLVGAANE
jgi:AcrR family transcriptional regulator